MRRLSRLAFPALSAMALPALMSCNKVGFGAVSIRPIYGWQDGCTAVSIGGHGFGSDVTVTIGGKPLENVTLPTEADAPLDVGYEVYGTTPPGDASGYAEVVVSTGGNTESVFGDFYYEACPLPAYPESLSQTDGVTAGTAIQIDGCNLVAGAQVKVGTADPVALSSVCHTASASFSAPALADGTYLIAILDADGNELYPANGCDTTGLTPDDTADTGPDACADVWSITYGGGAK